MRFENYDLEVEILTYYSPAPPCSNPDNPAFSDIGSDCEYIIHSAYDRDAGRGLDQYEIDALYSDHGLYEMLCALSFE